MKKLILFASALCMSVCTMAQSEFYVYKKDGSSVQFTIADVDSISFTSPATAAANGHEWVDLGLSVKWATCNVGANKPEEYGNYYAWGETTTKATYSWNTYTLTTDGGSTFTKYTTDGKTVLELADDAARANWGGTWRMPTDAEWTELRENCTWTWTNDYNGTGVAGRIVTSNINGNSIFLPAAGYRCNDDSYHAGNYGHYWSSSLFTGNPRSAWYVNFYSDSVVRSRYSRDYGLSVRPVL
ncbi:MAG: hypothetical protein PUD89_00240 [Bacteroidales bacterium]|nr:hypothetical protein [Bacteroidales bacterium]